MSFLFGGGSSPSGSTTSTQVTQPWPQQQPFLVQGMNYASDLLNQGGPQYYPGNTYSPVTQDEWNTLGKINQTGMAGGTPALQADQGYFTSLLGNGYTAGTQPGMDAAQSTLTGQTNLGGAYAQPNATYGNLASGGGNSLFGGASNALSGYLDGSQLDPFSAPGFQNVVNNTMASVMPSITAGFGAGNRLDSGLATRAASQGATDAVGQLANQNYLQEQGLQQQAAQTAAGIGGQELGGMLGGAQGLSGNTTAQQQLQQGAASALANNFLTQQGNQVRGSMFAPSADAATMGDLQSALGLGSTEQQNNQAGLTADINRFNYQQALPWNLASMYMGDVSGNYGNTSTMTQPYYQNQSANILGGLGGLASIGNGLFGSSGMFPGALSAIASLF